MKMRTFILGGFCCLLAFCPSWASAHRADYIDETLVYLTVESGNLEPEYWLDFGNDDGGSFTRHNLSLEYGVTDHWMAEDRTTLKSGSDGQFTFDSARFETRYRFFEEGEKPVDFAVSGELNTQRLPDGSYQEALEPMAIFSKDFHEINLTLNLSEEIPLAQAPAEFHTAFGLRYDTPSFFNLGSELKYGFTGCEGSIVPQVWIKLPSDATFKAAYSAPFGQNTESFWRFVLEVEFESGGSKPHGDKDDN